MGYYLYLILMSSYFLHLPARVKLLAVIHFDVIITVLTLIAILASGTSKNSPIPRTDTERILKWLIVFIVVTIPIVTWPGSVIRFGAVEYIKVIIFFYYTVALVNTEKKLKTFMFLFIFLQTFRIAEPAYMHYFDGYWGNYAYSSSGGGGGEWLARLSGAPSDVINANQLAWIVVTTMLFLFYLGWHGNKKLKLIALALAPLYLYTMLLTGSRTGLVILIVVIISIALLGKNKVKRITVLSVMAIPVVLYVLANLSGNLQTRYLSIVESDVVGSDTASKRISSLAANLKSGFDRPIVGHGLGTSGEVNVNIGRRRFGLTHNMYIEIFQEIGFIGFVIFMLYIKSIVKSLFYVRGRLSDSNKENLFLSRLADAMLVWVIMELVYSLATFGLTSWEWYLFGGVSVALRKLADAVPVSEEKQNQLVSNPA